MKRVFRRILIATAIILLCAFAILYWGTYGEGTRSGVIMKVSKRGVVFKTSEGQLDMQGFGAVNSVNQFSEVWEFSIQKDRDDLIERLEKASLSGERIELRYIERYAIFPWRGDTKYFVREVIESN